GVGVERDDAIGIEIVAGAVVAVPAGVGIAGTPEGQVGFGIVGSGDPDGAAAVLPRFAGPGLGLRLIGGCGRSVEAPDFLARLGVECGHPAIGAFFVGGGT